MTEPDIRWKQRLTNYQKALAQLTKFIEKGDLNELEEQGLIKAFEYTYELAWNLLRDYFRYQGIPTIYGSRDAIREAFSVGIIEAGESWMDMIQDRNQTSHTYNLETARAISQNITVQYYALFVKLQETMQRLADAD